MYVYIPLRSLSREIKNITDKMESDLFSETNLRKIIPRRKSHVNLVMPTSNDMFINTKNSIKPNKINETNICLITYGTVFKHNI